MFLKMVPEGTNIKFLKWKKVALAFSVLMMVGSIGLFAALGLNIGIDFAGGTMIQVKTEAPADVGQFREIIGGLDLGDVSIQEFGSNRDLLIRIESDADDKERQAAIARLVKGALNAQIQGLSFEREEFVGPKVSEELVRDGILAVLFAVGAVLIYIWFRFEWHFGVGDVIALAHDVILTIGFFAVTRLEFNLSIIAAILTIIGYSLNDTVVVYDRIREKLRKYRKMELEDLLDLAINKTLNRTVMTSVTTLLALFALFFFGGEVIRGFTAAMIWGVFVGTYSSIFIATPALVYLKLKQTDVSLGDVETTTP